MTSQSSQPSITIGVIPRERFAHAAESLRLLFEHTDLDFELIYVDCLTPARYWTQIERELDRHSNVRVIHRDEWLLPHQSKQLVAEASTTELTCLMENDLLVTAGWLTSLVDAMRKMSADVVVPRLFENSIDAGHGEQNLGHFVFTDTEAGKVLSILPLGPEAVSGADSGALHEVEVAEPHCYLFKTEVLKRTMPFQELINTRDFIDVFLTLKAAGVKCVYQPASRLTFMSPPPVHRDERPYYSFRWDMERAVWSHARIKEKWDLAQISDSVEFVRERRSRTSQWAWFWFRFKQRLPRRIARVRRALLSPLSKLTARRPQSA